MRQLLNCRECDWHQVVEGPSAVADVVRETHEESIRNALSDKNHCPTGSVAWVVLKGDVVGSEGGGSP